MRLAFPARTGVPDNWDRRESPDTDTPAQRETGAYLEPEDRPEKREPRESVVLQLLEILLALSLVHPVLLVLVAGTVSTDFRVPPDGTDFQVEKASLGSRETREMPAFQECQAQEAFRDREERKERQGPGDSPENWALRDTPVCPALLDHQAPQETLDSQAPVCRVPRALQVTKERRERGATLEYPAWLANLDYPDSLARKVTPVFPVCRVLLVKRAAKETQPLRVPPDPLDLPVSLDLWDPKATEVSPETPETRASRALRERRARVDSRVFLDFRDTTDNQAYPENQEGTALPVSQDYQAKRVTGELPGSLEFPDCAALTASLESLEKRETLVSRVPLDSTDRQVSLESRASRVCPVRPERRAFPEMPQKRAREGTQVSLGLEGHLDRRELQASTESWGSKEMLVCLAVACLVFKDSQETRETTVAMESQEYRAKKAPRAFPDSQDQRETEATLAFLAHRANRVVMASPAFPD